MWSVRISDRSLLLGGLLGILGSSFLRCSSLWSRGFLWSSSFRGGLGVSLLNSLGISFLSRRSLGGLLGRGSGLLLFNGLGCWLLVFLGSFFVALLGGDLFFLEIVREELLVLGFVFLGGLEPVELGLLCDSLPSESLLGDQALDLGGRVEGLVTLLYFSAHNVLSHVVLLSQTEEFSQVRHSLRAESSGLLLVGNSRDILLSLLKD
jgi:hypothetical protein